MAKQAARSLQGAGAFFAISTGVCLAYLDVQICKWLRIYVDSAGFGAIQADALFRFVLLALLFAIVTAVHIRICPKRFAPAFWSALLITAIGWYVLL